ncbi:hypothetical protein P4284_05310 [Bacillus swezeyi]|uniref:hypothetical protein n=1 Tax=Bacillus swezeyi TaxID=1925020 RepID=UPI002E204003|nr:hypothetical protein [Bacillus swezeyi]
MPIYAPEGAEWFQIMLSHCTRRGFLKYFESVTLSGRFSAEKNEFVTDRLHVELKKARFWTQKRLFRMKKADF